MPDGDIIHKALPRIYQRPYRYLCEGKADDAECSKALQRAIKRDLQKAGDPFATAALVAGDLLARACSRPQGFDPGEANRLVDASLRTVHGPDRYREAFRDGVRDVVQGLRYGTADVPQDMGAALYSRFVCRLADAQFESRVPMTDAHHNGAHPVEVESRIRSMAPDVERAAAQFGKQISAGASVEKLRLPPQKSPPPVSLDENLL